MTESCCGKYSGHVQSGSGFSSKVFYVRFECHPPVISYFKDSVSPTVWYGSVVECDMMVDAVFTVIWR